MSTPRETVVLPIRATVDQTYQLVPCFDRIARGDARIVEVPRGAFFGPIGVAMIAAAAAIRIQAALKPAELRLAEGDEETRRFVREVGLASWFGTTEAPRREGTLAVRQMTTLEPLYTEGVADLLAQQVAGTSEELSHLIQLCLNELLQNTFEHARSKVGAVVHCRWYANSGNLRIAVVDAGIGIPAALRIASKRGKIKFNQLQRLDDAVLIVDAVTKTGFTSREGPRAGGLGLKHLHEIATSRGGRLVALSLGAKVEFQSRGPMRRRTPYFRGTAVELDFRAKRETQ